MGLLSPQNRLSQFIMSLILYICNLQLVPFLWRTLTHTGSVFHISQLLNYCFPLSMPCSWEVSHQAEPTSSDSLHCSGKEPWPLAVLVGA